MFRGAFPEDDPSYWKDAVSNFLNKVPRFTNKKDCEDFIKNNYDQGSNPDEPHLRHSISTLTCWTQIENYLIPRVQKYHDLNQEEIKYPDKDSTRDNIYMYCNDNGSSSVNNKNIKKKDDDMMGNGEDVYNYLSSRMNLPIHQSLSYYSTINTLNYLFYHMRCGILVMIRNGQLVVFCPFVNRDYRNKWSTELKLDCHDNDVHTYYSDKGTADRENYISDKSQWWANGNIICNVHSEQGKENESQWWGDHFMFQLQDMVAEVCRCKDVPDCDFFINKRDYPHLKFNDNMGVCEPYGFIFDKDDNDASQDLLLDEEHCYKSYSPILSFYTSDRFADIPMPPSEDWEAATGEMFPPSFILERDSNNNVIIPKIRDLFEESNLKKFERPWDEKVATAFFRGTATGGGVTTHTNQRLHVSMLSHEWNENKSNGKNKKNSDDKGHDVPYLDAKITGMNKRDKKIAGCKMTHIKPADFPFTMGKHNFTPIYEQSKFKYLLYIEGHCAACRYGFMMRLGSVILKVESKCVADSMWYFPLLRPYHDHVPVKADLSDLQTQIEWCRNNDGKCKTIAENAIKVYNKYVSKSGIIDYLHTVFVEISKRTLFKPSWMLHPPSCREAPLINSRGVLISSAQQKALLNQGQSYFDDVCYTTTCCDVQGLAEVCASCKDLLELRKKRIIMNNDDRKNSVVGGNTATSGLDNTATSGLDLKQQAQDRLKKRQMKRRREREAKAQTGAGTQSDNHIEKNEGETTTEEVGKKKEDVDDFNTTLASPVPTKKRKFSFKKA